MPSYFITTNRPSWAIGKTNWAEGIRKKHVRKQVKADKKDRPTDAAEKKAAFDQWEKSGFRDSIGRKSWLKRLTDREEGKHFYHFAKLFPPQQASDDLTPRGRSLGRSDDGQVPRQTRSNSPYGRSRSVAPSLRSKDVRRLTAENQAIAEELHPTLAPLGTRKNPDEKVKYDEKHKGRIAKGLSREPFSDEEAQGLYKFAKNNPGVATKHCDDHLEQWYQRDPQKGRSRSSRDREQNSSLKLRRSKSIPATPVGNRLQDKTMEGKDYSVVLSNTLFEILKPTNYKVEDEAFDKHEAKRTELEEALEKEETLLQEKFEKEQKQSKPSRDSRLQQTNRRRMEVHPKLKELKGKLRSLNSQIWDEIGKRTKPLSTLFIESRDSYIPSLATEFFAGKRGFSLDKAQLASYEGQVAILNLMLKKVDCSLDPQAKKRLRDTATRKLTQRTAQKVQEYRDNPDLVASMHAQLCPTREEQYFLDRSPRALNTVLPEEQYALAMTGPPELQKSIRARADQVDWNNPLTRPMFRELSNKNLPPPHQDGARNTIMNARGQGSDLRADMERFGLLEPGTANSVITERLVSNNRYLHDRLTTGTYPHPSLPEQAQAAARAAQENFLQLQREGSLHTPMPQDTHRYRSAVVNGLPTMPWQYYLKDKHHLDPETQALISKEERRLNGARL